MQSNYNNHYLKSYKNLYSSIAIYLTKANYLKFVIFTCSLIIYQLSSALIVKFKKQISNSKTISDGKNKKNKNFSRKNIYIYNMYM